MFYVCLKIVFLLFYFLQMFCYIFHVAFLFWLKHEGTKLRLTLFSICTIIIVT